MYSVTRDLQSSFANSFGTNTLGFFVLSSYIVSGEAGTNAVTSNLLYDTFTPSTGSNPFEKFNSRSPAPTAFFIAAASAGTGGQIMALSLNQISHVGWKGDYKRKYVSTPDLGGASGITQTAPSANANVASGTFLFTEDTRDAPRRMRRGKNAFFPHSASYISHHEKTGSGAFAVNIPHCQNDGLTWLDPRAWVNGMSQSNVWSIQQFGSGAAAPVKRNRLLMGIGV